MDLYELIVPATLTLAGTTFGYYLAGRKLRLDKQQLLQKLDNQALELLDVKATLKKNQKIFEHQQRREQLLKMTLAKLQKAKQNIKALKLQQQARDRSAYIELSHMRMNAVQAREKVSRLRLLAKKASKYIERLEMKQLEHSCQAPDMIERLPVESGNDSGKSHVKIINQKGVIIDSASAAGSADANDSTTPKDRSDKLKSVSFNG